VAFAQASKDEQEILKIHQALEQAYMKNDIAYFERVTADDYILSTETGRLVSRAQLIEDARKEMTKPTYKVLSATSDGVKVKVSGNMAFVTGNWAGTTVPPTDATAEPHMDKGRYTGIYEKRGDNWLLVVEHFSEAPHDRKLMEQQVLKLGQEYSKMIQRGDAAAIAQVLAEDFTYTDEKGKILNKTEDLATYKDRKSKFELTETTDQKVRVIGNNAAVETGIFHVKGMDKDGKPFDDTYRYTTTWVWRGGRWQVAADHTSKIKK
jgi:ketosteroid isomerase-like protein